MHTFILICNSITLFFVGSIIVDMCIGTGTRDPETSVLKNTFGIWKCLFRGHRKEDRNKPYAKTDICKTCGTTWWYD